MRLYISHSAGCSGWQMKEIYEGTLFKIACRTSRFKPEDNIEMLDWDFREWKKKPEKIENEHLRLVKEYDFETIMSMDLWENNVETCLEYTDKLLKYGDRVLIPAHHFCEDLFDYSLSYPNANWFDKNVFPPPKYRQLIKHLLGGSPQSQFKHLDRTRVDLLGRPVYFKNVESLDGNQIFNVSIIAGKIWFAKRPHWRKPKKEMTNEEIFRESVRKLDRIVKDKFLNTTLLSEQELNQLTKENDH